MDMQLENQLKELLKDNMPEVAGGLVLEEITRGREAIVRIKSLNEVIAIKDLRITRQDEEISHMKEELETLALIEDKFTALNKRQLDVEKSERDFEVKSLRHELATEKVYSDKIAKFTDKIVGHPETKIIRKEDRILDGGEYLSIVFDSNKGQNVTQPVKSGDVKETFTTETTQTKGKSDA